MKISNVQEKVRELLPKGTTTYHITLRTIPRTVPNRTIPYHTIPHHTTPYVPRHTIPYLSPYQVIPSHTSYQITPYHIHYMIIWSKLTTITICKFYRAYISYRILIPYHITLCHIKSYHIRYHKSYLKYIYCASLIITKQLRCLHALSGLSMLFTEVIYLKD